MKELYLKYKELINYIIFGFLTVVVSLSSKWLLLFTIFDSKNELELQTAIIISWIISVTFAYITNRIFVFESKNINKLKEIIKFYLSRVSTLLIEMLLMGLFIDVLNFNTNKEIIFVTLICQIIIIILNYVFSKVFVFKTCKNK